MFHLFFIFPHVFPLFLFEKMWGAGCFTSRNGDKYPQMWDQGLPAMTSTILERIEMMGETQEVDEEEGLVFVEEVRESVVCVRYALFIGTRFSNLYTAVRTH